MRGWSDAYVAQLHKAGRLVKTERGLVLVHATDALLAAVRDPARGGKRVKGRAQAQAALGEEKNTGGGAVGYQHAATVEKLERARKLQIENARAMGEVVLKRDVVRIAMTLARDAAERLKQLKYSVSDRCALETDPLRIESILAEAEQRIVSEIIRGTKRAMAEFELGQASNGG
jgi:hypothetical protein